MPDTHERGTSGARTQAKLSTGAHIEKRSESTHAHPETPTRRPTGKRTGGQPRAQGQTRAEMERAQSKEKRGEAEQRGQQTDEGGDKSKRASERETDGWQGGPSS
eukprot:6205699-Pleurochrysis_carterae.AAC.2